MKIKALNIFTSIQGEGTTIGEPSTFIRLPNCNLSCPFCDTSKELSLAPIEFDLSALPSDYPQNLIITGGEPLLPSNSKTLANLLIYLYQTKNFKNLTIETNGTLIPPKSVFFNPFFSSTLYSVSPKFDHINSKVLEFFNSPTNNSQFKFVIDENQSLDQLKIIQNLIKDLELKKSIILQPQTSTDDTLSDYLLKCKDLIEETLSHKINAKVIPQFHYILKIP